MIFKKIHSICFFVEFNYVFAVFWFSVFKGRNKHFEIKKNNLTLSICSSHESITPREYVLSLETPKLTQMAAILNLGVFAVIIEWK